MCQEGICLNASKSHLEHRLTVIVIRSMELLQVNTIQKFQELGQAWSDPAT